MAQPVAIPSGNRFRPLMKLDRTPGDLPAHLQLQVPGQQLLQEHAHLQPGQPRSQAEVRPAAAEGDVAVGVSAQVQRVRIGEGLLVVVGRQVPGHDLVARRHGNPGDLGVGDGRAPEMDLRGGVAQNLLDGGGQKVGIGAQACQLVGPLGERQGAVIEGVAGGLVAGDDQQEEQRVEVLRRQFVGGHQQRHHVVGGVAALGVGELPGVGEHPLRRGAAERQKPVRVGVLLVEDHLGVVGVGVVYDPVGPLEKVAGVLVGHPEDAADHQDRKPPGHGAHELHLPSGPVAPGPVQRLVEDPRHDPPGVAGPAVDAAAGEVARHHATQAGVLGQVGLQHGAPGLASLGVALQLLQLGPADLGGERLVVAMDRNEVLPARDRPEPCVAARLGMPGHRRLPPQACERLVRDGTLVDVVAENVDRGERPAVHSPATSSRNQSTNCCVRWVAEGSIRVVSAARASVSMPWARSSSAPNPIHSARSSASTSGWNWQSQAPVLAEGLRTVLVARDLGGALGDREAVVVPLEPGSRREPVGLVGVDAQPAELGGRRPRHRAAQGRGQHLTPEARPKHGTAPVVRPADEVQLAVDPGSDRGVVVHRPDGAQDHDQVVVAGVGELAVADGIRHVGDHPEGLQLDPTAFQRLPDECRMSGRVVLDGQPLHRRIIPAAGEGSCRPARPGARQLPSGLLRAESGNGDDVDAVRAPVGVADGGDDDQG